MAQYAEATEPEKAKRQIALLGKMLLYSVDHLTQEDHQTYDDLVEDLAAKADSKKKPAPAAQREGAPPDRPPAKTVKQKPDYRDYSQNKKLQGMKPEMVVRLFVECWDKQDFKQEYFCLSDDFQQGRRSQQTLEEYVASRYEKFSGRHLTGHIGKSVVDISAPIVEGDMAAVQVAERHSGKDEHTILYRTYSLVFQNTAWRIVNFKTNQTRVRKKV